MVVEDDEVATGHEEMSPTPKAKDQEQLARRQFALDTIRSLGINPDVMFSDSLDVNGYETWVSAEDGSKLLEMDTGKFVREYHEWPSLKVGINIVDLLIQSGWRQ